MSTVKRMFSIIIPLCNKEKYIRQTIESVLSQTIADYEIIVVDDGSTDSGPYIVKGIHDPRLKYIAQGKAGVSAARNRGIREAAGEYICFLDADDLWKEDYLSTVLSLFQEFPLAGMVCTSYQVSYDMRTVHPTWRSVDLKHDSYVHDFYEMATAPFWICNSSCAVVKSCVLQEMPYWFPEGECINEDYDFFLRLGGICPIAHSNKVCVTYQRNAANNSRTSNANKVIYSTAFMQTLSSLLSGDGLNARQKYYVKEIWNRRMVPYIFSLLVINQKRTAKKELANWKPIGKYQFYKLILMFLQYCPHNFIHFIQIMRFKLF